MSILRWMGDLVMSGPPVVERSGAIYSQLIVSSAASPSDRVASGSELTYTIYGPDGVALAGGTATAALVENNPGLCRFVALVTPDDDLDITQIYREHWAGPLAVGDGAGDPIPGSESDVSVWRDVYPTDFPQRQAPISAALIAFAFQPLAVGPANIGTWQIQIARAWYDVSMWAIRQRRGNLWTPGELSKPCLHLALHYIHDVRAMFGSSAARVAADASLTSYSLALQEVQLGWDTDGVDGVDAVTGPGGSAVGSGALV
jgi:hypothetical protein